jgi:hypothetical protein
MEDLILKLVERMDFANQFNAVKKLPNGDACLFPIDDATERLTPAQTQRTFCQKILVCRHKDTTQLSGAIENQSIGGPSAFVFLRRQHVDPAGMQTDGDNPRHVLIKVSANAHE